MIQLIWNLIHNTAIINLDSNEAETHTHKEIWFMSSNIQQYSKSKFCWYLD